MADSLSLQEAADALGVHYMTAYRWVRGGRLPATKRAGRLEVAAADVEALIQRPPPESAAEAADRQQRQSNVDQLAELLLHGSAPDVERELARLVDGGRSLGDLADTVVTPSLQRITDLWEMGAIDERTASRAATVASGSLSRRTFKGPALGASRGSVATLSLPSGHAGPPMAVLADQLRNAGWEVHHLGHDVRAQDLAVFVDVVPVDVVCVWVDRPLAPEVYQRIADACHGRQVVLVGADADHVVAEPLGIAVLSGVEDVAAHLDRVSDNPDAVAPASARDQGHAS